MKNQELIIDITNNFFAFWLGHCIYIRATSHIILNPPSLPIEITIIRIEEAIILQKMIKKSSIENITNFLQMPDKLFSKKRR